MMDEEKIEKLKEHPIVRLMEDKTSFTLDDLLEGHAKIIPQGESPVPPAEFWPIEFSQEGEEKLKREYEKRKQIERKDGVKSLIRDAALQVWAYSDASRTDEQGEAVRYWLRSQKPNAKMKVDNKEHGSLPRKKRWAEELAKDLAKNFNSFTKAWESIPISDGYYYADFEVYRGESYEGKECLMANHVDEGEDQLGKESFRTGYFQQAKKNYSMSGI